MKTVRVVVAASAAAGWRSLWPPSSRSSVPRAMKDRSHIPAATFAISGNSHMAMCGFSGISTANLRLFYIINPMLREKARSQHSGYSST